MKSCKYEISVILKKSFYLIKHIGKLCYISSFNLCQLNKLLLCKILQTL